MLVSVPVEPLPATRVFFLGLASDIRMSNLSLLKFITLVEYQREVCAGNLDVRTIRTGVNLGQNTT